MKKLLMLALALASGATFSALAAETEAGFTSLFNGKDLTGWDGNPKLWSVQDGAIVGRTTAEAPIKANTFLIWTNGTTEDFELRCSFRITANNDKGFANSGIQYRSKVVEPAGWVVGGYQADLEAGPNYTGILYDEKNVAGGRGIMAARGEKVVWDKDCKKQVAGSLGKSEEIQAAIKAGDWNDYVIIAQGNHLQHFVNGKPTVDVTDECASQALQSGVLALQVHVGGAMTAEFKNLRFKKLAEQSGNAALDRMRGTWEVGSVEADGAVVPAENTSGITLTLAGGRYTVSRGGEIDRGSFSVDATKSPGQMDVHAETGPFAGRTMLAIYEMSGDTLKICYAVQGTERPKAFSTEPESGRVVINYKRKQQ